MKGGFIMISYNIISNVASDIVKKRRENGIIISSDDTVCVLCTNTGNIYTGISGLETRNGLTNIFHAEVDAVNNMYQHGESIIESVSVFSSISLAPILPCNSCLNMMVSLAPENINTVIVTPTGNIKVTEIGVFAQSIPQPQYFQPGYGQMMNQSMYMPNQNVPVYNMNGQMPGAVPMTSYSSFPNQNVMNQSQMAPSNKTVTQNDSSYMPKAQENAGADLLKNKLNGLLSDDDDEVEEQTDTKKKKRGLFR